MGKIVIAGCGWLGMQVAENMANAGFEVWGSTSNETRQASLKSFGATPFLLSALFDVRYSKTIAVNAQTLLLALPPSSFGTAHYASEIEKIVACFEGLKHIIFCSSISVYGESADTVDETSPLNPATESAKAIVAAENTLVKSHSTAVYILRLAGLYGLERNPAKFLQGKKGVAGPLKQVNLIDGASIVQVVKQIASQTVPAGIYNVVNPQHPSRQMYYTAICEREGMVPPEFMMEDDSTGKIVNADKMLHTFQLQLPNLLP